MMRNNKKWYVWNIFVVFTVISFGVVYNGYSGAEMLWAQEDDSTIAGGKDESQRIQLRLLEKTIVIETEGDRITLLSDTGTDVGPDFAEGTADDDTVGPFFLVKGNIVRVDGEPAEGFFICRGVILTDTDGTSFPFGLTQVSQTFIVNGRGVIYTDGLEFFDPGFNPCRIVGGAGEFEGVRGVYLQEGAPFPISTDGKIKFTFFLKRR